VGGDEPRTQLLLRSDRIDLWASLIEDARLAGLFHEYRSMLSRRERDQEAAFRFAKDRERFLVTRALVRTVLSRYAAVPPSAWDFGSTQHGRPFLLPRASVPVTATFNVSHTNELIILAVGVRRILGVDVESLARKARPAVTARWFTADEKAALSALPPDQRDRRFVELWTLKESYVKASGEGLSFPLDRLDFDLATAGHIALSFVGRAPSGVSRCLFWQLALPAGHVGAVCTAPARAQTMTLSLRLTVPLDYEREVRPVFLRASAQGDAAEPIA
jgi:4'-phosphopantetheinyl transferase